MAGLEGQTFAGYEVVSLLGRGGMGAVWKARHTMLNRFAALKMMAPELAADAEFVKRFKREATSAANLSHEHLVQVYSAGEFEGTHYIAMEFVEGETLRGRIERHGKLDPCEALAITTHIAEALQYAWNTAKLIHRDIKPDNIFLSNTGDVKVGDMGLAKTVGGPTTSLTQTGMMMGSPHYISPEQARGVKEIDFRADIYSLGCTLYHMLTGRPPYEGDDSLVVINKHVNAPPPAIFNVWPTCPVALAVLVGKMVAKKPHERPQSYEELIAQLREVHDKLKPAVAAPPVSAGEPTKVATPKPTPKAVKPRVESRVSRAGIAAGAVALVVLLAGLLLWSPWKKPSSQYSQTPSLQSSAADAAAALKLLGSVYTNAVGAEMVYIPPGEFLLGSTKEEQAWAVANGLKEEYAKREGDAPRKATIKEGFWMGRTEVTVGQWKQFVNATGYLSDGEKQGRSHAPQGARKPWGTVKGASWKDPNFTFKLKDNHPVSCVSCNDAVAFCKWLNEREQRAGRLPAGHRIRLPTEAEWEYACRGGLQSAMFWWGKYVKDGQQRFNWGGTEDGFEFVSPVDHYAALGRNGFGLADMLGNVLEWCLDGWDPAGAHEEVWEGNVALRVVRGGSFLDGPGRVRCAYRAGVGPGMPEACIGFRVCCGPELPSATPTAASTPSGTASSRVDDAFIREVAALPAEQQVARVAAKLKELNPGFDGQETHKIENGAVTELAVSIAAVTDISPVRALTTLRKLNSRGTSYRNWSPLRNLSPLQGLPLTDFACALAKISDLSPLKGMPLKILDLSSTDVSDLSPLQGMPLIAVAFANTPVSDLSPLQGMALSSVNAAGTRIGDLSPLKGMPLTRLRCGFVSARDAAILRSIKTLETINGLPAAEFWRRVDAGESPQVK